MAKFKEHIHITHSHNVGDVKYNYNLNIYSPTQPGPSLFLTPCTKSMLNDLRDPYHLN